MGGKCAGTVPRGFPPFRSAMWFWLIWLGHRVVWPAAGGALAIYEPRLVGMACTICPHVLTAPRSLRSTHGAAAGGGSQGPGHPQARGRPEKFGAQVSGRPVWGFTSEGWGGLGEGCPSRLRCCAPRARRPGLAGWVFGRSVARGYFRSLGLLLGPWTRPSVSSRQGP